MPESPSGPPLAVTTVRVQQRDLPVLVEATGTVTAINSVDIKLQATSVVARVHVHDDQ